MHRKFENFQTCPKQYQTFAKFRNVRNAKTKKIGTHDANCFGSARRRLRFMTAAVAVAVAAAAAAAAAETSMSVSLSIIFYVRKIVVKVRFVHYEFLRQSRRAQKFLIRKASFYHPTMN